MHEVPSKNHLPGHSVVLEGVDKRLLEIADEASKYMSAEYEVKLQSAFRKGDKRFHGKGKAIDVAILKGGIVLPNYQDAKAFRTYEIFAQICRKIQHMRYPELDSKFAWGGYFGGPRSKYGSLDSMHMDVGGARGAGGSFEHGLTVAQKKILGAGGESEGMGPVDSYKLPIIK